MVNSWKNRRCPEHIPAAVDFSSARSVTLRGGSQLWKPSSKTAADNGSEAHSESPAVELAEPLLTGDELIVNS